MKLRQLDLDDFEAFFNYQLIKNFGNSKLEIHSFIKNCIGNYEKYLPEIKLQHIVELIENQRSKIEYTDFVDLVIWDNLNCLDILYECMNEVFIDRVSKSEFVNHFLTNNPNPH